METPMWRTVSRLGSLAGRSPLDSKGTVREQNRRRSGMWVVASMANHAASVSRVRGCALRVQLAALVFEEVLQATHDGALLVEERIEVLHQKLLLLIRATTHFWERPETVLTMPPVVHVHAFAVEVQEHPPCNIIALPGREGPALGVHFHHVAHDGSVCRAF